MKYQMLSLQVCNDSALEQAVVFPFCFLVLLQNSNAPALST